MSGATPSLSKTYNRRSKLMFGPYGKRYYTIIYAIDAPCAGLIKFGRTLDVEKRFSSISTMSPVPISLLGHVWLPDDAEADIHMYLKDDRAHGEWFAASDRSRRLAELIAEKRAVEIGELIGMQWMLPEYKISQLNR